MCESCYTKKLNDDDDAGSASGTGTPPLPAPAPLLNCQWHHHCRLKPLPVFYMVRCWNIFGQNTAHTFLVNLIDVVQA